ncbi:hypothetical protein [Streptomyces sp. NPDC059008]
MLRDALTAGARVQANFQAVPDPQCPATRGSEVFDGAVVKRNDED